MTDADRNLPEAVPGAGDAPASAMETPATADAPAIVPERGDTPRPVPQPRIGVLLVNLGTPDAPTPEAVRAYLREFLTDPRVIEKNSFAWKLVLNGIVLRFRPRRKARDYLKIWNRELNESPLKTITRSQAEKLIGALNASQRDIVVDWAMRYGSPSIASRLQVLAREGCDRILLVPLYPQYAAATTATVCDEAFRALSRMRRQPTMRVAAPYYDDPIYIQAIASSIREKLVDLPFTPDVIVASFHGIPVEYAEKGDPYPQQCMETMRQLRAKLGMGEDKLLLTFQSRFGRDKWLQPYTDKTVRMLARGGVKNLVIVTPGFSADCLETLEEIAGENAKIFKKYGGENFAVVPCLNDSDRGMLVIRELVQRELRGWL
jgi:ferrochelatase